MAAINLEIAGSFINLIHQAQGADGNKLKALRKQFVEAVDKIGARQFVDVMADILKDNFKMEGCNDARIPLKGIFRIPLEELEAALARKAYGLPEGHPLSELSLDHQDNIKKLSALYDIFKQVRRDDSYKKIIGKKKDIEDYYAELDRHIKKEEEVFFPALEEAGMKEHPENLRQEHKKFRQIFSDIFAFLNNPIEADFQRIVESFRSEFVPDIANHVFREAYIFYPAALEFIKEDNEWTKVAKGFKGIK